MWPAGSNTRVSYSCCAVQLYKVRPLRAAARGIPERGGAGQGTAVEERAVHGRH